MNICIPKDQIIKIQRRMKELGSEKISNMSFEEIHSQIFAPNLDEKSSLHFAKTFSLALASERSNQLTNWFKKNMSSEEVANIEKRENKKSSEILDDYKRKMAQITDKEAEMELIENILNKADRTGETTQEELDTIYKLTKELAVLKQIPSDNPSGYTLEYYQKLGEIEDYFNSINPMTALEMGTKIWSRGAKLASLSSPLFNIISNTSFSLTETITRSLGSRKFPALASPLGRKLIMNYVKEAHNVFVKTNGIDITRALLMSNKTREVLGETFRQVAKTSYKKDAITYMTYIMQQGVFKYAQGLPDIWFSAYAFADSVYVQSARVADEEGYSGEAHTKRTEEIASRVFSFREVENEHDNQKISTIVGIREVGVKHAQKATGQDERKAVQLLLNIRGKIDDIAPKLNLGTAVFDPFVKTPANFKITSLFEYSPIGFIKAFIEIKNKEEKRVIFESLGRAGLGVIFLALLRAYLDDDEYMNAYEVADKKDKVLGNYYNSILVKGYAISTDVLGILQAPTTMLFSVSKASGDSKASYALDNVKAYLGSFPVVDTIGFLFEKDTYRKSDEDLKYEYGAGVLGTAYSMLVPSIFNQLSASYDGKERSTDYTSFLRDIAPKIPSLRKELAVKQDAFGNIKEINPYLNIMFGARVKSVNQSNELDKLRELTNNVDSITLDVTQIAEVKALKTMLDKELISKNEYNAIMFDVRADFGKKLMKNLDGFKYTQAKDYETKKNILLEGKKESIQETLKRNGIYTRVQFEMKEDKKKK